MKKIDLLLLPLSLVLFGCSKETEQTKPNIVYILADDLGYGDVQVLSPERGKIATPVMDRLAAEGMIFTDAHSGSSVCTPTRYGILTGRYSWRTHLQRGVLYGYSQPLIAEDRLTVAGFLGEQGYNTAAIGKWHLGLGMPTIDGKPAAKDKTEAGSNVDWTGVISDGPVDRGFDYFYGISASLDMDPYIYIENDRFVGECTTQKAFHRLGPSHADFEAVDVLPEIGRKTVEFIQRQEKGKPFFAYVAFTSPHTPIVPSPEWQGKSELGAYGDFTMQTDAVIGQIVDAIDEAGFGENTIVIVTSDNGCSKAAGILEMEAQGHFPSAHLRGSKADLWDGGHRVPFIVRWPAKVKPGSLSDQTISLTDLMATCADLLDTKLPGTTGEDSVSFLPALSGQAIQSSRAGVIHHSISGHFAYRQGKWKLLLAKGSGGWTSPREGEVAAESPAAQLYDLENDLGETSNLFDVKPGIVGSLMQALEADVREGRSTAGPEANNDIGTIELWKSGNPFAGVPSVGR